MNKCMDKEYVRKARMKSNQNIPHNRRDQMNLSCDNICQNTYHSGYNCDRSNKSITHMENEDNGNNIPNRSNFGHNHHQSIYRNDPMASCQRRNVEIIENEDDMKRCREKKVELEEQDLELAMLKNSLKLEGISWN